MFILYAVVIGLVIGLVTGGRPARLGQLRFRWAPAIIVGLLIQVAIFSTPLGDALGVAAPWVYAGSTLLVLVAVARNLAIPGLSIVVLGGASNLLAIVANGGYMPVSADALRAMGRAEQAGYSNSRLFADVRLAPLTDVFAMPTWMPAANVFSVGDVLIGVGVAIAIVLVMHGRGVPDAEASATAPATSPTPSTPGPATPAGGASAH
jgi:hypothetical protein